jgi:hypothetical protein
MMGVRCCFLSLGFASLGIFDYTMRQTKKRERDAMVLRQDVA